MKNIFPRYSKRLSVCLQEPTAGNRRAWIDPCLLSVASAEGKLTLFSLAVPMIIESFCNQLIGMVSTALISGYSEQAVSALGAANTVLNFLYLLIATASVGASIVVCQLIGKGNKDEYSEASGVTLVLCIALGVIFGVGMWFCAKPLMRFMHLMGKTFSYAVLYFRIRAVMMPILAASAALIVLMRSFGYPKFTLILCFFKGIINYLLCLFVIRLPQHSPVKGVPGVAVANGASILFELFMAVFFILKLRLKISLPRTADVWQKTVNSIVRVGVPASFSNASYSLSQMVTISFLGEIGDTAMAAKIYFSTVFSYVYLFGYCIGKANSMLVGRMFGSGDYDRADRMTRQLFKITVPLNLSLSLLVLVFRVPILSQFTDNRKIFAMAIGIMLIDTVVELARAFSHITEYALQGTGDVTFSMVVTVLSGWGCSIGLGYLLGIVFGWGLIGFWIALAIDEMVRCAATVWRWYSKKWCKTTFIKEKIA